MKSSIWHIEDRKKCLLLLLVGREWSNSNYVVRIDGTAYVPSYLEDVIIFLFCFCVIPLVPLPIHSCFSPMSLAGECSSCTFCNNLRSPMQHIRLAESENSLLFPAGLSCICSFPSRAKATLLSQSTDCTKRSTVEGNHDRDPHVSLLSCLPFALVSSVLSMKWALGVGRHHLVCDSLLSHPKALLHEKNIWECGHLGKTLGYLGLLWSRF